MNGRNFMIGVPYLEVTDFNSDGSLKNYVGKGKPVLIMVQGNFCGFCAKAKPDFEAFSKIAQNVVAVTLQTDGSTQQEKDAAKLVASTTNNAAKGVPAYLLYGVDGKFKKAEVGLRTKDQLQQIS